jgi:hypothetical protein
MRTLAALSATLLLLTTSTGATRQNLLAPSNSERNFAPRTTWILPTVDGRSHAVDLPLRRDRAALAPSIAATDASSLPASASFIEAMSRARADNDKLGKCRTCVYVLERIKQGYQYLLPSICVEIFSKTGSSADGKKDYAYCHQTLAALSVWGNNVKHWLQYGCYKSEEYGAMELIKPCPSHVICSQMQDLDKKPFCKEPASDFPTEDPTRF